MERITKRRFDLVGKMIYRELVDGGYWLLTRLHGTIYEAYRIEDGADPTDEKIDLTVNDIVDDYVKDADYLIGGTEYYTYDEDEDPVFSEKELIPVSKEVHGVEERRLYTEDAYKENFAENPADVDFEQRYGDKKLFVEVAIVGPENV